jgi:hypothetical protein
MWKIFSVPCGSALYTFHCINTLISVLLFKDCCISGHISTLNDTQMQTIKIIRYFV